MRTLSFILLMVCLGTPQTLFPRTQGFYLPRNVKSVKIPVEIQNNIILVSLRINGKFEMDFILDSGVRTTLLTEPGIASLLGLGPTEPVNIRGLGDGDLIQAQRAKGISMELGGGLKGEGMNLLVLPHDAVSYSGMFGKPVYGIIGYDVFGQFVVEINYQQKFIRVHNPFSYRPHRKYEMLPLQIKGSKPYVQAKLRNENGYVSRGHWLLDTGSSNAITMFDEEVETPTAYIDAFLGRGLSGTVHGKLGRAPRFEIGSHTFKDLIVGYPDSSSLNLLPNAMGWYGNIGAEILSRFHIAFDYHRNRFYFRKAPKYKAPFEYNLSGIEITSTGADFDVFLISYVRPNSPADVAGLRVNDQVVAMNGFAIHELELGDVYGVLNKKAGRFVNLKIRRNGRTFRARFRLTSEI
ncbi:MAG: aspartyl protease family protein [Bacteroidota bacterium]